MWRGDHVRVAEQRVLGHRLALEHVERHARDLARVERILQRVLVDQPAARDVQQPHAVSHRGERGRVDEAFGLGCLGQVDRDEVRLGVDVLDAVGLLHAQLAVALGADERVEGKNAHVETTGALGHELSDAPEADDPERLFIELHAGVFRAVPFAFHQRRVRLRHVAGQGQQQRHRVLRRRHDV